jgi:hypothetical protein
VASIGTFRYQVRADTGRAAAVRVFSELSRHAEVHSGGEGPDGDPLAKMGGEQPPSHNATAAGDRG